MSRTLATAVISVLVLALLVVVQTFKEKSYLTSLPGQDNNILPAPTKNPPTLPPKEKPSPLPPLPFTPDSLLVNDTPHGLLNDLDKLFTPIRGGSVLLIGDSTMRQLMNTVVGIIKAHEEFKESERIARLQPDYMQPFTDMAYKDLVKEGATSLDVLNSVMSRCPTSEADWRDIQENSLQQHHLRRRTELTIPIKFGGRCAYGANTRFYTHKGATKTPIIDSYDVMFLNHGTGAGGAGTGWGTNDEERTQWIEEVKATATAAGRPQPKLIVANSGGLHMLHVYPDRMMEDWVKTQVTGVVFKEAVIEGIKNLLNLLAENGGGTLVYKSTNAICDGCFYGNRRHIIEARNDPSVDGVECTPEIEHCRGPFPWSSDKECDDYIREIAFNRPDAPHCLETSIAAAGAKRIYLLELEAIAEVKEELRTKWPTARFEILDTHAVTEPLCTPGCECDRCDGLHWPLANTLFWSIMAKGIKENVVPNNINNDNNQE